jgi:hypothetical protein
MKFLLAITTAALVTFLTHPALAQAALKCDALIESALKTKGGACADEHGNLKIYGGAQPNAPMAASRPSDADAQAITFSLGSTF